MVIARDMAYRMRLDEQTKKQLQRRHKRHHIEVIGLQPAEQKHIEAAFWGSNYAAGEIIEKIQKGDRNFEKRLKENISVSLY